MNIVAEMQTALNNCNSSTILPTPVQLPCTELHVASWERKSHHERRQDISASLRHLFESVKVARPIGQAECGSVLLLRLERNINSYLLILTHLQLSVRGCQGAAGGSGKHGIVLCSSKYSQSEHVAAQLQAAHHGKTGAVDDEPGKRMYSPVMRGASPTNQLFICSAPMMNTAKKMELYPELEICEDVAHHRAEGMLFFFGLTS
ncbi:thrombopoietin isoform X2 [Hippocampus comes]|nr:PREDICTED: uncharacterized protein LOC109521182 isoform X2 [Hippocampus comes]